MELFKKDKINLNLWESMPDNLKYFTEIILEDNNYIPDDCPTIGKIISVDIETNINNFKLIESKIAKSNEGKKVDKYKLIFNFYIDEKLKYASNKQGESMHILNLRSYEKTGYIVLPEKINNKSIMELIRKKSFIVKTYNEDINCYAIHERLVYRTAIILVYLEFI